ncbi:MAG: MBL fold metallo-hydrolase, partial [Dehalococcoidia bacterium]|nr:MBL fold metallo-hydrolase [Dehalococcoidia bacterium]
MEITARIHSIPAPEAFYTGPQAPNVFLVTDGGEGALIDSGFGDEQSLRARLEYLRERPDVKVRYIILTHHHFDHSSGAHRLRQASGAQVVMHPQEERFLRDWQSEAPQDIDIPAGQGRGSADLSALAVVEQVRRFRQQAAEAVPVLPVTEGAVLAVGGLSLEVVHTPGHTLGSICVYIRGERALFTGDTALGLGTVAISPPPYGDMALYLQSLERLKAFDASVMLPGHGRPVEDVARKLQELIDHRHEREEQVLRLLA